MSISGSCPLCGQQPQIPLDMGFVRCQSCNLALRPEESMPLRQPFEYSREWLQLQEASVHHHRRARHAFRLLRRLAGGRRALDVGCGTGILVDLLARNGFEAYGLDSSPVLIDYNRQNKAGTYFLSQAGDLRTGDDQPYDLVIAAHLIEHLRDPWPFLNNVRSCLSSGGYLYIETPNLQSYSPHSIWRRRCGGMAGGYDHRILYSPASLTVLLERAGFNVCRLETWTYSPLLLRHALGAAARWVGRKVQPPDVPTGPTGVVRPSSTKRLLEAVLNSTIVDWALRGFNRLSQVGQRGVQLGVLARYREPHPAQVSFESPSALTP